MKSHWEKLDALRAHQGELRISDLFASDPQRAQEFFLDAVDMGFDYSKTLIDGPIRKALIDLAQAAHLQERRDAMFRGDKINLTEGRAVLHTALRNPKDAVFVDGHDVSPGIRNTLARMRDFSTRLREGTFVGQGGKITDVINIGIGGSDLGPAMATRALRPYHDGPKIHFVSNIDGADITDVLTGLDRETTLIIVASKTFTTVETLTNARTAWEWMAQGVTHPGAQFAALSSAGQKTAEWGIDPDCVFGFEDWVGGRYSIWGPIGLSLMIAIGPDRFDEFLAGGAAMDHHFRDADLDENMPVLLALIGIWHHQICGYPTRAVLPYDNRLGRLPAYLQQLEMESNGKSMAMDGAALAHGSGPVIWGEPGTNGQHAFYQLIHQGTGVVPCEFILAARGHEPDLAHHHVLLAANCLAQSEALMRGRSLSEARALLQDKDLTPTELERQARHRVFPGNRPSTTLLIDCLTPRALGQIIALYEHRVFVEGVILGLNSFDQWGVELGKELALSIEPLLKQQGVGAGHDTSTRHLAALIRAARR